MGKPPDTPNTLPQPKESYPVTSQLFEAYLACPTKCYLLFIGEPSAENSFATWKHARGETYRLEAIQGLTSDHVYEFDLTSTQVGSWKHALWRFAVVPRISAQNLVTSPHVIERLSVNENSKSLQLVPIRFAPENKLSRANKLTAGFDALVLSRALNVKVELAKIIHGEHGTTLTLKPNIFSREINLAIGKIAAVLSAASPPNLSLNKHCIECEFQDRCRKKAVEKDDLSLLSTLQDKERSQLNSKGIFTVHQLSYTFRPRRRIKRRAAKAEKYHHALRALAIREQKIYIVGNPQLRIEGTPIILDVEGLPDRDFYYLIGLRVGGDLGVSHHSFWADRVADEERVWTDFLRVLSGIDRPVLIHYGSFETTFLKKMCQRYGAPPVASASGKAIASSLNILSIIYAQVYFPTYSNGLKDIARFLGFEWTNPASSGLQSIVWRHEWEASGDWAVREKLTAYNIDDCEALSLVVETLGRIFQPELDATKAPGSTAEIVREDELAKNLPTQWPRFKSSISELEQINGAARWDYQQDRVFVRTGNRKRNANSKKITSVPRPLETAQKIVVLTVPISCPECGSAKRKRSRVFSNTVYDLVFGRDSVKRRIVKYVVQTYKCLSCGHEYGKQERYFFGYKWGPNIRSYFLYHIIGLRVPQLTMRHSINRLFSFDLSSVTLHEFKVVASKKYLATKSQILNRIVNGNLIHADETRANIKGRQAYVWVLTNLNDVVYILSDSREGEMIRELLSQFRGVLVSDFYAAYDSIDCPQQKCLIHLIRDLNTEILDNPFDSEMKVIVTRFAELLKPMVDTIDRHGLKRYFLHKHLVHVERFYKFLDKTSFSSEPASKCKKRFEANRDTLFTFLRYDGVPWNNNNAEHAIKAFAGLRDVLSGSTTKAGLDEYLTLLSVAETCKYRRLDFLDFLRSGETDVETFARYSRKGRDSGKVGTAGERSTPAKDR